MNKDGTFETRKELIQAIIDGKQLYAFYRGTKYIARFIEEGFTYSITRPGSFTPEERTDLFFVYEYIDSAVGRHMPIKYALDRVPLYEWLVDEEYEEDNE